MLELRSTESLQEGLAILQKSLDYVDRYGFDMYKWPTTPFSRMHHGENCYIGTVMRVNGESGSYRKNRKKNGSRLALEVLDKLAQDKIQQSQMYYFPYGERNYIGGLIEGLGLNHNHGATPAMENFRAAISVIHTELCRREQPTEIFTPSAPHPLGTYT